MRSADMPEPALAFQRAQREFAAYIRDPRSAPAPADIRPERMELYRELFLNNVESFLANGFPVLREILSEPDWSALVEDFFARHRCRSPLFSGIPEEFLDYLQNERPARETDPPFLLELAHYEWVELALSIAQGEAPADDPGFCAAPLERTIHLSELAWPLAYRYPVQRIGSRYQPEEAPAEPTCLTVYRDREDRVRFLELNTPSYRLLQILAESGPQEAKACLRSLALESGHSDPEALFAPGTEILRQLATRSVIGCG